MKAKSRRRKKPKFHFPDNISSYFVTYSKLDADKLLLWKLGVIKVSIKCKVFKNKGIEKNLQLQENLFSEENTQEQEINFPDFQPCVKASFGPEQSGCCFSRSVREGDAHLTCSGGILHHRLQNYRATCTRCTAERSSVRGQGPCFISHFCQYV